MKFRPSSKSYPLLLGTFLACSSFGSTASIFFEKSPFHPDLAQRGDIVSSYIDASNLSPITAPVSILAQKIPVKFRLVAAARVSAGDEIDTELLVAKERATWVWSYDAYGKLKSVGRGPTYGRTERGIGFLDVNGDGRPDVVTTAGQAARVFLALAGGGFAPKTRLTTFKSDLTLLGIGDFNGDHNLDFLFQKNASQNLYIQFMAAGVPSGLPIFAGETYSAARTPWSIASVGDFSGDGKADILWAAPGDVSTERALCIRQMNGSAIVQEKITGPAPAYWTAVAMMDAGYMPVNAEVADWAKRVLVAGDKVPDREMQWIDEFVTGAKVDGFWSNFVRLNLFYARSVNGCFVPLVSNGTRPLDANNGFLPEDYTFSTGLTSDGTKWLETPELPVPQTGFLAVYLRTNVTGSDRNRVPMGSHDVPKTQIYHLEHRLTGNYAGAYGAVRAATVEGDITPGFYQVNRSSLTGKNGLILYRNGISIMTNGSTITSNIIDVQTYTVFGERQTPAYMGGIIEGSIGAYAIGTSMTPTQAAAFYARIQTLMTHLGRQVSP